MIDWKERYEKAKLMVIIAITVMNIGIMLFSIKINEQNEKIWQQSVEIEDLKEQIYILNNSKESEEI